MNSCLLPCSVTGVGRQSVTSKTSSAQLSSTECQRGMLIAQWLEYHVEFKSEDPGFDPLVGQGEGRFVTRPSQLLCRLVCV